LDASLRWHDETGVCVVDPKPPRLIPLVLLLVVVVAAIFYFRRGG
jgi:hypothetical protein